MITRTQILNQLLQALKPIVYIHAMIEAGAASFNRVDQWSDIDLGLISDDDKIEETIAIVDQALAELTPIDVRYRMSFR